MKVGVTGTRDGMTDAQEEAFGSLLEQLQPSEFHHGDCIGVDARAASIAFDGTIPVHVHPPVDETRRAFFQSRHMHEPKTHFARNRDIVDETDVLIVVPKQATWQAFGGTWYTHDYAAKRGKRIIIVWPDGTVREGAAEKAKA